MKRYALVTGAYLLDQVAGDPEWFPHPVRVIGFAISSGEARLRRPTQSANAELISGACLTVLVVGASYWLTASVLRLARRRASWLGDAIELLLGWTCLAARNLEDEATAVTKALERGDVPFARVQLARIVGRDTLKLDPDEMSRAVIETVAESLSDGIIAPLFYLCAGGAPLAMAYKAVNTLDSMIGHADTRYFYFGKAAARLDDAANFLPSRLSAVSIAAASFFHEYAGVESSWKTWRRDRGKHKSPNAGQPESAMAGALKVALGGENTYDGERVATQRMGAEFAAPSGAKAQQAIRLVATASLLALGCGVAVTWLFRPGRRG